MNSRLPLQARLLGYGQQGENLRLLLQAYLQYGIIRKYTNYLMKRNISMVLDFLFIVLTKF